MTPWTVPPGSSVHEISQVSILRWVAISSSRGSSWPRDRTHVSCISRQTLYQIHQGSPCPILQMKKWNPREVAPKFTLNVKLGFEAASAGSLFLLTHQVACQGVGGEEADEIWNLTGALWVISCPVQEGFLGGASLKKLNIPELENI